MRRRQFLWSGLSALAIASARPATLAVSEGDGRTLKESNGCGRRLIGTVADRWQMEDSRFLPLILANFNLITLGKLKWGFTQPRAGTLDFSETDWMVAFCKRHGLLMHGHTLCWNANNPAWLPGALTPANAEAMLTGYISTVLKRYDGAISSYDVVNEPVAPWMGRADGLYPGPWLDALGPRYIDVAFHAAEAADPRPLRVLNVAHVEQGGKGSDEARARTLELVRGLVERKVPVQAVGLESHLAGDLPCGAVAARAEFIRELRRMGLQVLITELDIDDTRLPVDTAADDAAVARSYGDYLQHVLLEAEPARVIFFSPSDRRNWYDAVNGSGYRRSGGAAHRPGLFDAELQPKAAFGAVSAALQQGCGAAME